MFSTLNAYVAQITTKLSDYCYDLRVINQGQIYLKCSHNGNTSLIF